jgi:hypothetical protein
MAEAETTTQSAYIWWSLRVFRVAAADPMAEQDAKLLVERLVGFTGDDHERFLLKIKNRFDR